MYKTFWLKSHFVGESQSIIDGQKLSKDLEALLDSMTSDNLKAVSIIPVISGNFEAESHPLMNQDMVSGVETYGGGYGYGFGFSFTDGLIVIARGNDPK